MKLLALSLALLSAQAAQANEITVAGAASLKDALTRIAAAFERVNPQTQVRFQFGASGSLQSQIENGAPIDIFIAASPKNITALSARGLVDAPVVFARGELVLIAPLGSTLKNLQSLSSAGVRRVAVGGPGVPAGDYARQTLSFYGLNVNQKVVHGKDVRAVLAQVSAGNADAGFVYRTDALTSSQVRIVQVFDARSHSPIIYPMAKTSRSPNPAAARGFQKFCRTARAQEILRSLGFRVKS